MARISVSAGCVAALMLACFPVDYGGVPSTSDLQYLPDILWGTLPDGGRLPDAGVKPPLVRLPDGGFLLPDGGIGFALPDGGIGWQLPDGGIGFPLPDGGIGWQLPDGGIGWPGGGGTGGGGTGGGFGGATPQLPYVPCAADNPCQVAIDGGYCIAANDSTPCQSPCGFDGHCQLGACALGERPIPTFSAQGNLGVERSEQFYPLPGNRFLGHAYRSRDESSVFRVLEASGATPVTISPTRKTRAVFVDGESVTHLGGKHVSAPEYGWALERFPLLSGVSTYAVSGAGEVQAGSGAANSSVSVVEEGGWWPPRLRVFDTETGSVLWAADGSQAQVSRSVIAYRRDSSVFLADARTGQLLPVGDLTGLEGVTEAGSILILRGSLAPRRVPLYRALTRLGQLLWERDATGTTALAPLAATERALYFQDGRRIRSSDGAPLSPFLSNVQSLAFATAGTYLTTSGSVCFMDEETGLARWCVGDGISRIGSLTVRPDGVWYTATHPTKGTHLCQVSEQGEPLRGGGTVGAGGPMEWLPVDSRAVFSEDYVLYDVTFVHDAASFANWLLILPLH